MKMSFQFISRIGVLSLALGLLLGGCKKEYDSPPLRILPIGQILTIQELRDLYQGDAVRFPEPFSVYCVVTADEQSGNLYRSIYVQDATGALTLRLNNPGGLYEGDSIRIYLPGTILNPFSGLMQLDSVDVDNNIIKQATQVHVEPELVEVNQITPAMQGKLIRLENVEFMDGDVCMTYSDAIGQTTQNRLITNCNNNTVIVRTSGFANFANQPLPQGNGSIIAVVSQFNTTMQLLIRKVSEVQMAGERCTPITCDGGSSNYLFKDFQDQNLTSGGWKNFTILGTGFQWEVSDQGSSGNYYAKATGYLAPSNNATELWLVSPSIDLGAATTPGLEFRNAKNFNGPALQLLVSGDYDGTSSPNSQGIWQDYTGYVSWSPSGFAWTDSGVIPMTSFNGNSSVFIAYRYTSTASQSATWEVDDIIIKEY